MNILDRMADDVLNEKISDYFYNLTFFKLAKSYVPELKKIMMKFLQSKHIKTSKQYSWTSERDIDFADMSDIKKLSRKDKRETMHGVLDRVSVYRELFSASSSSGGLSVPDFEYKGIKFNDVRFSSSEDFFENGHNLSFNMSKLERKSINRSYKINILRPVKEVLNNMWELIENAVSTIDDEQGVQVPKTPEYEEDRNQVSEIQQIFNYTLKYFLKKSRKKSQLKEVDPTAPIEFSISNLRTNDLKPYSSFTSEETNSFTIQMKLRGYNPNGKFFKEEFPEAVAAVEKYKDFFKQADRITQFGGYAPSYDLKKNLPDHLHSNEHEEQMKMFEKFCYRVARIGYIPSNFSSASSKRDSQDVSFKRSSRAKKLSKLEIDNLIKEVVYDKLNQHSVNLNKASDYFDKKIESQYEQWLMGYLRSCIRNKTSMDPSFLEKNTEMLDQFVANSRVKAKIIRHILSEWDPARGY